MTDEGGFWTLVIMEMDDTGSYWPGQAWRVADYEGAEADARRWYVEWLNESGYMDEEYSGANQNPAAGVEIMSIDMIQAAIQQLGVSHANDYDDSNQHPYPTALFVSNSRPHTPPAI